MTPLNATGLGLDGTIGVIDAVAVVTFGLGMAPCEETEAGAATGAGAGAGTAVAMGFTT